MRDYQKEGRARSQRRREAAQLKRKNEREAIIQVLRKNKGNRKKSAAELKMERVTLNLKVHRYKILRFEWEVDPDLPFREDPRLLIEFSE